MGYQRKIIQAERCNRFTVAVLIDCYHVNRKNSFSWTIYEGLLTALEIRGHTGKLEDVPASDVERGILPESIQQHQVDGIILLCPFPMEYCKSYRKREFQSLLVMSWMLIFHKIPFCLILIMACTP